MAVFLATTALLALVWLAAGMNEVSFESGSSYWLGLFRQEDSGEGVVEEKPIESPYIPYIWLIIIAIFGVAILEVAQTLILPDRKKRRRSYFIQGIVFIMIVLFLFVIGRQSGEIEKMVEALKGVGLNREQVAGEPIEGNPVGDVVPAPEWVVIFTSAALAVGLLLAGWRMKNRWSRPHPLAKLAQEAEEALESIRGGGDLRGTIQRCYYEMSEILRREHDLQRGEAMTVREFERLLEESGLPRMQVQQLSRLFERVRYGATAPSPVDERIAVDCLSSIVQAATVESGA